MRNMLRSVVVLLVLLGSAQAASAAFGAIAYSESTGKYGYSYNCATLGEAETIALSRCDASDAFIAVWVQNGWAALAVNDRGAYGYGWSTVSQAQADANALNNVSGGGGHIRCWVASGN